MPTVPSGLSCLTVRPPITACGTNLVQNPGFQLAGSSPPSPLIFPWMPSFPEGASASPATSHPLDGSQMVSAMLSITGAADFASAPLGKLSATVSQSVSIGAALHYALEFVYYVEPYSPGTTVSVFCYIDSPANGADVSQPVDSSWESSGTAAFTVPSPALPVSKLVCGLSSTGPATAYLDNIELYTTDQCAG